MFLVSGPKAEMSCGLNSAVAAKSGVKMESTCSVAKAVSDVVTLNHHDIIGLDNMNALDSYNATGLSYSTTVTSSFT